MFCIVAKFFGTTAVREKCLYSKLFWSTFSRIGTEYGEILCISPYSVRMRENEDQNNFEYGLFLSSVKKWFSAHNWLVSFVWFVAGCEIYS